MTTATTRKMNDSDLGDLAWELYACMFWSKNISDEGQDFKIDGLRIRPYESGRWAKVSGFARRTPSEEYADITRDLLEVQVDEATFFNGEDAEGIRLDSEDLAKVNKQLQFICER